MQNEGINVEDQNLMCLRLENNQIQNNFELTSNGMIKMKKLKEPKYLKNRYKQTIKVEE